jgi:hypothetical protein
VYTQGKCGAQLRLEDAMKMQSMMRLLGTALLGLALSLPAAADDDYSLSLRLDNGSRSYVNGSVYAYDGWGNSNYYDYNYNYGYTPGISLNFSDGGLQAYYGNYGQGGRKRQRGHDKGYVNDFSYGYGETGTHANDRGGYRLFIPRGLESGSERVLPNSQYLGLPQIGSYGGHRGNCYNGCGCGGYGNGYYGGGPLVIQYGYPSYGLPAWNGNSYYYPGQQQTLYTAPSYPEFGYDGDGRYRDDSRHDEPNSVVNDNSVTNNYYYYGNGGASGASLPSAPETQPAPALDPRNERPEAKPAAQSYSTRFRTETRLELTDSVTLIKLSEEGRLSVGPENGPAQTVSAAADREFGCFATWHDEQGLTLVFREGNSIMGAYDNDRGWWSEALSADVDFSQEISISTMNGEPWLKFTDQRGQRVIMKFASGVWQTVGYGTVGNQ